MVVKPPDALIVHAGPDQTVTASGGMYAGTTVSFNGSYSDPSGTVSPSGIAWDFNYDGTTFIAQCHRHADAELDLLHDRNVPGRPANHRQQRRQDLSTMQVTVAPHQYTGPTATAGPDQTVNEGDTARSTARTPTPTAR